MPSRHREEPPSGLNAENSLFYYIWWQFGSRQQISAACDDVIGDYGNDHTLNISRVRRSDSVWNGVSPDGNIIAINMPCQIIPPQYPNFPSLDITELSTKLAARTNPSRATVMLPVFIFELRDLPRLVQLAGRSVLGKLASANLSWQFGWKPLIGDLTKLLNFQSMTMRRVKELERLQSKSGLRRRVTLQKDAKKDVIGVQTIESFGISSTARVVDWHTREVWGTIRWRPNVGAMPQTDEERYSLARRISLGLHHGSITAQIWEAIPWSWLIDWFANVQDFIEAQDNSIAHISGPTNIMSRTRSTRSYEILTKNDWVQISSSPWMSRDQKERFLGVAPSLTASLPFLSGGQLSILGSLATLRLGR